LRLGGSRRGLSATLAISLFAGGGPGLLAALAIYFVVAGRRLLYGTASSSIVDGTPMAFKVAALIVMSAPEIALVVTLILGLAGAHGIRRRRAAAAVLFSLVALGSVLGLLHEHVRFALGVPHFVVMFDEGVPNPDVWF
jgi:hypothetical protein